MFAASSFFGVDFQNFTPSGPLKTENTNNHHNMCVGNLVNLLLYTKGGQKLQSGIILINTNHFAIVQILNPLYVTP